MNDNCNNLDDFLAEALTGAETAAFAAHLQRCDECREAVGQQQWIEGLLQSPLRLELEPVPGGMAELKLSSPSRRGSRRTKYLAMAMASAAVILIAVDWIRLNRQADDGANPVAVVGSPASSEKKPAKDRPRATFVSNSNGIAVPLASPHSDVTVVRIYPAYRPRYATQTASIEPEAATSNNLNVYSNGG